MKCKNCNKEVYRLRWFTYLVPFMGQLWFVIDKILRRELYQHKNLFQKECKYLVLHEEGIYDIEKEDFA